MRSLLAIAIGLTVGIASAAPRSRRVVLVDEDPELLRAMTTALRPWKLEVVVDRTPVDKPGASARADALHARFVVWRDGKELVVFDRERGDAQHRDVATGTLDPVDAASAALSVKTLMRLPDPEHSDAEPGTELRVQLGTAARMGSATSGRVTGAVMLKPIAALRIGIAGDLGTGDEFEVANFSGTWRDWSVLAIASWTVARTKLELEPWLAGGVTRSHVFAEDKGMKMEVDEHDTLGTLRGGVAVRYRLAPMWSVGVNLGIEATLGTPTYTRPKPDNKELYDVPALGVTAGLVVAADLWR